LAAKLGVLMTAFGQPIRPVGRRKPTLSGNSSYKCLKDGLHSRAAITAGQITNNIGLTGIFRAATPTAAMKSSLGVGFEIYSNGRSALQAIFGIDSSVKRRFCAIQRDAYAVTPMRLN